MTSKKIKIVIPNEIIRLRKLNLNKPIYIHSSKASGTAFYLLNKIENNICFGAIKLDEENSFELSQNLINSIYIRDSTVFYLYMLNGIVYLSRDNTSNSLFEPCMGKICIPTEFIGISTLNLEKPLYLYKIDDNKIMLDNRNNHKSYPCLGIINLDSKYSFDLSYNICCACRISSLEKLHFCVQNKKIVIST